MRNLFTPAWAILKRHSRRHIHDSRVQTIRHMRDTQHSVQELEAKVAKLQKSHDLATAVTAFGFGFIAGFNMLNSLAN